MGQVRAHGIAGIQECIQRGSRTRQINGFEGVDSILSTSDRGNEKRRPQND